MSSDLLALARTVQDATDTHDALNDVYDQTPAPDALMSLLSFNAYQRRDAQRCPACHNRHRVEATCAAMRDGLWALLRDRRADDRLKGWARARLGLADDDEEPRPQRSRPTGHVHGYARQDGAWRCVQDYYAVGSAPDTGCGATLDAVA